MEEKKPNIFKQLILSCYSFKDYPVLMKSHGGKMFLYMLLLISFTYLATFIIPTLEFVPYMFKIDTATVDEYIPWFEIKNGVFYIEQEVKYEDPNGVTLIYATSDYTFPSETAKEVLRMYTQGFIVNENTIVIKQATGSVAEYDISMMPDITRDYLYNFIPILKGLIVFMYVLVFAGYILVYLFGSLVCAMIGMLINAFLKAPVAFKEVFKLTAYARTVPIFIKMIFVLFTSISLHYTLFYALFILYMVWALLAVRNSGVQPLPPQDEQPSF